MTLHLFEGGTVVDGSGAPAVQADVLLQGERILAVAPGLRASLAGQAHTVTGCRGLVVAPGFIDVHTHDDAILLREPAMRPKVSQGITTVVTGNCGISLLPLRTAAPQPPLNLLGADSFRFERMADYAAAFEEAAPAVNAAPLVGHTSLRCAAMQRLDRPASEAELAHMEALLDRCLADGAIGLSSGLFYEPAFAAPASELVRLAKVVARHGGVYATHLRNEMDGILDAMHEAGETARAGGVPLVLSHHKCAGPANWGRSRETLPLVEAMARRSPVALDVYPYVAGSTVLREDLVDGVIDIHVTWSQPHPQMAGRRLADIAAEWGVGQQEACRRLQPGGASYFQMHEDDVERIVAHPLAMIGSDGLPHDRHPHPRLWGAFPRVLARYWRERGLFPLEQAVHKMTGLSARNFGLRERGELRAGWFADLVLFDPATVRDRATYDQPLAVSEGIAGVWVNGRHAYAPGEDGPRRGAGRLLLKREAR